MHGQACTIRFFLKGARARAEGKHLGRPYINGETEQAIRAALATGKGIRSVQRIKAERRPSGDPAPDV